VSSVNFDACALTNQCLLSAEALRDEIVCCLVFAVSASLSRVAVGTRTVRLSELSGRKICGVSSSVCIVPRSVGYTRTSSVDTWQADALISSPAFTSICVWGGVASFPGQRTVSICVQGGLASLPGQRIVSCRGVGK